MTACNCIKFTFPLFAGTWTVTSVCREHEGATDPLSRWTSGTIMFGTADYVLQAIHLARRSSLELEMDTLLHELSHTLMWGSSADPYNEGDANITALWFKQASYALTMARSLFADIPRPTELSFLSRAWEDDKKRHAEDEAERKASIIKAIPVVCPHAPVGEGQTK